jgi:hypothetical protein
MEDGNGIGNSLKESFMKPDSLLGVWTGTAHNSNGWDMKITLSILQPLELEIGSTLGIFDIPLLPCSGTFRVVKIEGQIIELRAERLQGDCGTADSDSLELLPDGTLEYVSTGKDWETRGILKRMGESDDE